jgi:hypothetical protein
MLGRFTALFDHAHQIPVLGSSRIPVRFHLWVSFAAAALAAVSVDRLERAEPVRLRSALWLIGGLVLVSIPILLYVYSPVWTEPGRWSRPQHLARFRWLGQELTVAAIRTLLLGLLGFGAILTATRTRSPRVRQLACWVLPVVVIGDLLGSHWHDVPTINSAYWTSPPLSARKLKADPACGRIYGLAQKSAGEPGYASEPVNFMAVRDPLGWSLAPVWGLRSCSGETPLIPRRITGFAHHAKLETGRFDLEGVTHFVTGLNSRLPFAKPERVGAALIYRNSGALPRARLAGRPYYAENEKAAVAAIDLLGPAIRDRLIVEDPSRPLKSETIVSGTAKITLDEPELVVIETDAPEPAYLVLADTFDPGWTATLDGRPVPIRPAWVTFRAVFLPGGRHTVVFRYRPAGFTVGLVVSLIGLVVAGALVVWPRRIPWTSPAHSEHNWPTNWPRWCALAALALFAASTVSFDGTGRPAVSSRWTGRVHQFTWGAGIEAMRPPPEP